MDNTNFTAAPVNSLYDSFQQARRNPKAFEEHLMRTNPQAYQQAMMLRQMGSPQEVIMRMLQQRGVDPSVLRMFNL